MKCIGELYDEVIVPWWGEQEKDKRMPKYDPELARTVEVRAELKEADRVLLEKVYIEHEGSLGKRAAI